MPSSPPTKFANAAEDFAGVRAHQASPHVERAAVLRATQLRSVFAIRRRSPARCWLIFALRHWCPTTMASQQRYGCVRDGWRCRCSTISWPLNFRCRPRGIHRESISVAWRGRQPIRPLGTCRSPAVSFESTWSPRRSPVLKAFHCRYIVFDTCNRPATSPPRQSSSCTGEFFHRPDSRLAPSSKVGHRDSFVLPSSLRCVLPEE